MRDWPSDEEGFRRAFAEYRDEHDRPQMVPSGVLFLDVLGTAAAAKAVEAAADPNAHVRELVAAIEVARGVGMLDAGGLYHATAYFTDNVVCAIPMADYLDTEQAVSGLLLMAGRFQSALALEGFLCRGAVSFGWHYTDATMAFGPALIEAVELEKAASTPRIVLGALAEQLELKHMGYYGNGAHAPQRRLLLTDDAGTSFVSYLDVLWSEANDVDEAIAGLKRHASVAERLLREIGDDPAVGPKVRWVAAYHNWFCDSLRKGGEFRIAADALPDAFGPFAAHIPIPDLGHWPDAD